MYGYDVISDSLYTIDINTVAATLLAPLSFDANFGQDLEWDKVSQTLYMAAFNNTVALGEFRIVDIDTGETTLISNLGPSGVQISWASIRNTTLSVDDSDFTSLTVFPNPAKDIITINTSAPITSLKVINMLGQIVLENNTVTNQQTIDISQLSKGTYFLQAIQDSGEEKVVRFIKE